MKLNFHQEMIEMMVESLTTCIYGQGIAMRCDVKYNLNGEESWIEFTPKEGQSVSNKEWFMYGFILNN